MSCSFIWHNEDWFTDIAFGRCGGAPWHDRCCLRPQLGSLYRRAAVCGVFLTSAICDNWRCCSSTSAPGGRRCSARQGCGSLQAPRGTRSRNAYSPIPLLLTHIPHPNPLSLSYWVSSSPALFSTSLTAYCTRHGSATEEDEDHSPYHRPEPRWLRRRHKSTPTPPACDSPGCDDIPARPHKAQQSSLRHTWRGTCIDPSVAMVVAVPHRGLASRSPTTSIRETYSTSLSPQKISRASSSTQSRSIFGGMRG